jgi:hypothetical protein
MECGEEEIGRRVHRLADKVDGCVLRCIEVAGRVPREQRQTEWLDRHWLELAEVALALARRTAD